MPELTPAERRGARWFVVLLLVGTLQDLIRVNAPRLTPPVVTPGPASGRPAAGEPGASRQESTLAAPAGAIDLNRATVLELDRLPGIGPVLARRIVEHRDRHGAFRSSDELLGVPGIGPRLLDRLRPHVTTGP